MTTPGTLGDAEALALPAGVLDQKTDIITQLIAAAHEGGHVAFAIEYDFPIVTATIQSDMPGKAGHVLLDEHTVRGVRAGKCFAVMSLAGEEAVRLYFANLPDDVDEGDIERATQILIRTRGGGRALIKRHGGHVKARRFLVERIELLRRRTRRLVRTPVMRRRIHLVRNALLAHGTLTGAELAKILA